MRIPLRGLNRGRDPEEKRKQDAIEFKRKTPYLMNNFSRVMTTRPLARVIWEHKLDRNYEITMGI